MRLRVYSRPELCEHGLPPDDAALLLEGSWPSELASPRHWSLDDAVDGRFEWIDRQAVELSELLGRRQGADAQPSPAYLDALALRYHLVKLIRPVAFFSELRPLAPDDLVELVAEARDKDYADVLGRLCLGAGAYFRVRWVQARPQPSRRFPHNPPWRRWLGRFAGLFRPEADRSGAPRVVLCGNPRLLDPVCRELLLRGVNLWWLYDRFAVRSWLRWQANGVQQLVCNSSLGRRRQRSLDVPECLDCRGINLALPVKRWLRRRTATHGPRHARLLERLDAHFRRVRPDALVLDEDATPLARAAVAVARKHGARSLVVQHGVPCCRFGFTEPAADRILVWGRSSQQQLARWEVPPERMRVTGAVQAETFEQEGSGFRVQGSGFAAERLSAPQRSAIDLSASRPPRILLLTTVPPRDDRPDAVALHLTRRTYAEMLRTAFATVSGIDGVEFTVKLHPRCGDDPAVRALQAEFPGMDTRVVCEGPLSQWLAGVDCALTCSSSAGVEAAAAGVPVIQLAPPRAADVLPHEEWGMVGTARGEQDLQHLLADVLLAGRQPAMTADVFAQSGEGPSARIADAILDTEAQEIEQPPRRRAHAA